MLLPILLLLAAPAPCESLAGLKLPDTTITLSQSVAAGESKPAYCRVAGAITPTPDSDIRFEVWLPASGWNGKFQGIGNGGFAGSISQEALAAAVAKGYAAASTDTGHAGRDAAWALGHREKIVDFGYRAVHEMTAKAKAIAAAFYGEAPRRSYFLNCSNGGRQALMEAQRYPADYDGIAAGAAANYWTHLLAGFVWNQQALAAPGAWLSPAKLKTIETAALAACDARDGLKDGLIGDPSRCRFDPSALLCRGPESDACLTAPQLAALRKIYEGPRDSKGRRLFPGFSPGAEAGAGGWEPWITGSEPGKNLQMFFSTQFVQNMVFDNPRWDFRTFDFDRDLKTVDEKMGPILNATNPDLAPFRKRGGKLILYHGWNDAAVAAENTVDYYKSVVSSMGQPAADSFLRLYMVPGMQHCGGGPGPNQFDSMPLALERWVEDGVAPGPVVGRGGNRTRPLCPWPQLAHWTGAGSPDAAANFVCK